MERLFCGGRHKVKPASLQNRLGNCESPQDCPRRVPDVLHLSHKEDELRLEYTTPLGHAARTGVVANTGGVSMKALRWLFLLVFVLSTTFAVTMLLAQAPAQAQGGGGQAAQGGGGGRGGPPPQAVPLSQEVANEDPQTETMRNDRMDFPPFKIIGNLYYVGTAFCGSYLIATPMGNILINTNFEETVPFMKKNIESLGFKFEDTIII